MAQVALVPVPVGTDGTVLTAEDLREVLEYEKILQFRDAVLAGTHPRVKIPPHLVGKQMNTMRNTSSPNLSTPRATFQSHPSRSTSGTYHESSSPFRNNISPNNHRATTGGHIPTTSKSEINPILLEKSDDLIKAEMQLQRQRVERALREQIEHQRLSAKAVAQTSESLPNFDISDVLSKALEIVHPFSSSEVDPPVDTSASDSFDEKTFYSSQHDTPEPSGSAHSQKSSVEVIHQRLTVVDNSPTKFNTSKSQAEDQAVDVLMTDTLLPIDNHSAAQAHSKVQKVPSHQQLAQSDFSERPSLLNNSETSTTHTLNAQITPIVNNDVMEGDGYTVSTFHQPSAVSADRRLQNEIDHMDGQKTTSYIVQPRYQNGLGSPLIRAHNLSPLAPQPARVSPLATARNPPILRESNLSDEAPPAQVAALRQKASGYSSTDSSPKGVKESGKKKGKKERKKKRKASSNGHAADTPESPYIKPEPRSPSPFAVAPLPRPQKRQRQIGQYASELNYDEPRYETADDISQRDTERYQTIQPSRTYTRPDERYEIEPRRPEAAYHRIERDDEVGYRRISSSYFTNPTNRPDSPPYTRSQTLGEARPIRAPSQAISNRRTYDEPIYYREPAIQASVRPEADRERSQSPVMHERRLSPIPMPPPRRPVRIIIDEYGREYIDPNPIPSMPPPPVRYREPEIIYERAPPRSVSGRAPVETYEEDGILYRRPSSPIALPRRVITQPEYALPDYRPYRQREYSNRPMGPPAEEYIQVRAPERRPPSHFEDAPREYVSRAPSVRPEPAVRYDETSREHARAPSTRPEPIRYDELPRDYVRATTVRPETVRYEIPREYRLQSVRPEPPLREYAASVRPEARREMIPRRETDGRPIEHHSIGAERYYDEGPGRLPAEVAFIERPRAREASVVIYTDDRREVYR